MSGEVSLAGRARLGIPKLDARVEAVVRAARGMTPLRGGADGPPQRHPRQSHLAQRPGREKEKHADTAAPHTQNNTKHSGVSSVVLTRSVHTQDSTTRNSHVCAVQVSPFLRSSSSPAIHRVSLCEVVRSRADGPPQRHPRQSHLAQRPGREKEKHADTAAPHTQNNAKHSGVSLTHSLTHSLRRARHTQCTAQERA